jgi:hypothetical protein
MSGQHAPLTGCRRFTTAAGHRLVLLGLGDRAELWDAQAWEAAQDAMIGDAPMPEPCPELCAAPAPFLHNLVNRAKRCALCDASLDEEGSPVCSACGAWLFKVVEKAPVVLVPVPPASAPKAGNPAKGRRKKPGR